MKRNCDYCQKEYTARKADNARGWGLCCSKSCAAKKREEAKPSYNPERVAANNYRRKNWNDNLKEHTMGDICFVDAPNNDEFKGRTSEGYRIYGNTAYDEWGEPIYTIT